MNTKVGKDYILPGETRKRNKEEIAWVTAWMTLLVGWVTFMIIVSINTGFWHQPIKEILAMLFVSNIPTLIFFLGFGFTLSSREDVRTLEFVIHQYERWNWIKSEYETFYITERVYLMENFVYYKHTGDTINKMSAEELNYYCINLSGDYSLGHKTKDEAMISILNDIKKMISNDKSAENIKIRNIKTLETFTVKDLKEKFEAKEFDHLLKK